MSSVFNDKDEYTIETFGNLTTVRVAELLEVDPEERKTISVRGVSKTVFDITYLEIEKVIRSQDHRENVKIYVKKQGEKTWHLCYPRKRAQPRS